LFPTPRDQGGHVGVADFVQALILAEKRAEQFQRMPRPFVVAMVLAYFGRVAAGCMTLEKWAVAGPLLSRNVRLRLGL